MNNTTHTPGPWRTIESTNKTMRTVVGPDFPGQGYIADVNLCRTNDAQDVDGEANARLIAAAPELLEALNAASEWLNDMGCEHEEPDLSCVVCLVNAAINKAEGRG